MAVVLFFCLFNLKAKTQSLLLRVASALIFSLPTQCTPERQGLATETSCTCVAMCEVVHVTVNLHFVFYEYFTVVRWIIIFTSIFPKSTAFLYYFNATNVSVIANIKNGFNYDLIHPELKHGWYLNRPGTNQVQFTSLIIILTISCFWNTEMTCPV